MNNRYLYRAKRIDNGEWVKGYYMPRPNLPNGNKHYIVTVGNCKWFDVDPSTICQCTGLKDKNGKLIFENDLVRFTDEININGSRSHVSKVEWNVDIGGFVFRADCIGFYSINPAQIKMYDVEVIGSAIENPEILEVRK